MTRRSDTEILQVILHDIEEIKKDIKEIKENNVTQKLQIQRNSDEINYLKNASSRERWLIGIFLSIIFTIINIMLKLVKI